MRSDWRSVVIWFSWKWFFGFEKNLRYLAHIVRRAVIRGGPNWWFGEVGLHPYSANPVIIWSNIRHIINFENVDLPTIIYLPLNSKQINFVKYPLFHSMKFFSRWKKVKLCIFFKIKTDSKIWMSFFGTIRFLRYESDSFFQQAWKCQVKMHGYDFFCCCCILCRNTQYFVTSRVVSSVPNFCLHTFQRLIIFSKQLGWYDSAQRFG